jgi:hypothetical protein
MAQRLFVFLICCILFSSCSSNSDKKSDSVETTSETPETAISNYNEIDKLDDIIEQEQKWAQELINDVGLKIRDYNVDENSCAEWIPPKKDELKSIIQKMEWQHDMAIHDVFNYYDCKISGSLKTSKGQILKFWLNAGGHISFKSDSKEFTMGAVSKELKPYFLSVQFSYEEGEMMMNSLDYISSFSDLVGSFWICQPFEEFANCKDSLYLSDGQGRIYSCERELANRIEYSVRNHELSLSVFEIDNVVGVEFISRIETYELEFGQLKLKRVKVKQSDSWYTLDLSTRTDIIFKQLEIYEMPEPVSMAFTSKKDNSIQIRARYNQFADRDGQFDLPISMKIEIDSQSVFDTIVRGYSTLYLDKIDSIAHNGFEFFTLKYGLEACDYPNADLVFYTNGEKVYFLDELNWFYSDYAGKSEQLTFKNDKLFKVKSVIYQEGDEPNIFDTTWYELKNGRYVKTELSN